VYPASPFKRGEAPEGKQVKPDTKKNEKTREKHELEKQKKTSPNKYPPQKAPPEKNPPLVVKRGKGTNEGHHNTQFPHEKN